jgi:hypothetical protein
VEVARRTRFSVTINPALRRRIAMTVNRRRLKPELQLSDVNLELPRLRLAAEQSDVSMSKSALWERSKRQDAASTPAVSFWRLLS